MMNASAGYVYIIELAAPLGNQQHQARFYIGWVVNVDQRLAEHRAGRGAAMLRAAVDRGIGFEVVATMPGDRTTERRLKKQKNTRRIVERMQRGTLRL